MMVTGMDKTKDWIGSRKRVTTVYSVNGQGEG